MAVNIKQGRAGELAMGSKGSEANPDGFLPVSVEFKASDVDKIFFVASRKYRVKAISGTPYAVEGAALTATIRKLPSGTTQISSGTALHSGSVNLNTGAATKQALTLSTTSSDLSLAVGDALAVDFSTTIATAAGAITVELSPL